MKEKINIKEKSGKNQVIKIDEIRKLLESNNDKLTLVFESGKTDDDYQKSLQKELVDYHVFNVRWMPEIWIYPAIETSKILEMKDEVLVAAKSFREEGMNLMKRLGGKYKINPFEKKELFELKRKSRNNKQRGKINEERGFWFHGAECQFKNQRTGQLIELVITNGSEFGALDSYFWRCIRCKAITIRHLLKTLKIGIYQPYI